MLLAELGVEPSFAPPIAERPQLDHNALPSSSNMLSGGGMSAASEILDTAGDDEVFETPSPNFSLAGDIPNDPTFSTSSIGGSPDQDSDRIL